MGRLQGTVGKDVSHPPTSAGALTHTPSSKLPPSKLWGNNTRFYNEAKVWCKGPVRPPAVKEQDENAAVLYSLFADPSNLLEHNKQHPLQPGTGCLDQSHHPCKQTRQSPASQKNTPCPPPTTPVQVQPATPPPPKSAAPYKHNCTSPPPIAIWLCWSPDHTHARWTTHMQRPRAHKSASQPQRERELLRPAVCCMLKQAQAQPRCAPSATHT